MVALDHGVEMERFHNGPWLIFLPSHFCLWLNRSNITFLQVMKESFIFMLIAQDYTMEHRKNIFQYHL